MWVTDDTDDTGQLSAVGDLRSASTEEDVMAARGTSPAPLDLQHEWDQRYVDADMHPWGTAPNATVVDVVSDLEPGDALDLGAGDGRNAAWLAARGWRVTAVDISPLALEQLRETAWGRGWDVTTVHTDLREWEPPAGVADLVLLSFLHLPQPDRGRVHRAAAAAVKPGGTLVLLAHDRSNLERGVGGPQDPALLPTASECSEELDDLLIDRAGIVEREVEGFRQPARDLLVVAHRAAG